MLNGLQFYFDLAFNYRHLELLKDFIGNKELTIKGFKYFQEYEYYWKDEMIIDDNEPKFINTIITKTDFLKEKLKNKKKILLDEINKVTRQLTPEDKKSFLREVFNDIFNIRKKLFTIEFDHNSIILESVKELIDDLILLYKHDAVSHKLMAKVESLEKISTGTYFGIKPNIKRKFFTDLYDMSVDLFLIDDEEISEDTFIEVFTCSKPNPQNKIQFIEKNYPIVYFLESIQPFFNNLSFTSIESSRNFFNKRNKMLTATDLSSTKSRNKNTSYHIISKIDIAVSTLKSKHLK